MQSAGSTVNTSGEFLVKKSVFLLTSAVGKGAAETLIQQSIARLGTTVASLTQSDIPRMAAVIEPALRPFVGDDQARKLASALRILVGGAVGQ